MGQRFRVSGKRMKIYIAAGCAGGIAGIFNAPLAGIFFAAEIVLLGTYGLPRFPPWSSPRRFPRSSPAPITALFRRFPSRLYAIVNPFVELPLYTVMAVIVGDSAVLHSFHTPSATASSSCRYIPRSNRSSARFWSAASGIFFPR